MKKNVTVKISTFLQITGIIGRTLKSSQVQKYTKLKMYHTLALSALLDECEIWESWSRINLG
jgi:hypothetical protein